MHDLVLYIYEATRSLEWFDTPEQPLPSETQCTINTREQSTWKSHTMAKSCIHQYFDITVDAASVLDDVFQILLPLKPNWKKVDIVQKNFSVGAVSSMTCFYHKKDNEQQVS